MENFNIFDFMYEEYKIKSELKVIELFADYGSQLKAINYLQQFFGKDIIKYKHYKICEWAIPSIIAYADLHRDELENYGKDFTENLNKEQLAKELFSMGVSLDYDKPAELKQLKRLDEDKLRLIYNSIVWSNNLVDVSRVTGSDLEIDNTKNEVLLTFSFPCQCLSLAGKMANLKKEEEITEDNKYDIDNRSNMLWQVVRIIKECKALDPINNSKMPTVMLMENVTMIHSKDNMDAFKSVQLIFENLGYSVWWDDLIATDFGIPQTRDRTFMVCILKGKNGETFNFHFPKKIPLKLRLKDLLETDVDEKYYLSDKLLQCFLSDGTGDYPRKERFLQNIGRENQDIANSITTLAGNRPTDNFVVNNKALVETLKNANLNELKDVNFVDSYNRKVKTDDKAITITTRIDGCNNNFLLIKNATQKGYLKATEGDGVDISSRMESHRGTVQKDKAQTITTMGGENVGVVVLGNYNPSNHNASRIVDVGGVAPTVMENHGTVTAILEEKDGTRIKN